MVSPQPQSGISAKAPQRAKCIFRLIAGGAKRYQNLRFSPFPPIMD